MTVQSQVELQMRFSNFRASFTSRFFSQSQKSSRSMKKDIDRPDTGANIQDLIWRDASVRVEMLMSDVIIQTCIHEAGHIAASRQAKIEILKIRLNPLQCNYGHPKIGLDSKFLSSGVEISAAVRNDALRYFYLGGILGEISAANLRQTGLLGILSLDPKRWENDLTAMSQRYSSNKLVEELLVGWNRSKNGASRVKFFENYQFDRSPEFKTFTEIREQHIAISRYLHSRWKERKFDFTEIEPSDVPNF